jgi:hypothetical protein
LDLKEAILFVEIVYFIFLGKQRSCDGQGGMQRPVWRVNEHNKTAARSARAHMRGQNPLVLNKEWRTTKERINTFMEHPRAHNDSTLNCVGILYSD